MTIKIDKEKCIGCGACVSLCPEAFKIGDDNKAYVKKQNAKCAKEAEENCPVDAIKLK